jgi:hypothetical protein
MKISCQAAFFSLKKFTYTRAVLWSRYCFFFLAPAPVFNVSDPAPATSNLEHNFVLIIFFVHTFLSISIFYYCNAVLVIKISFMKLSCLSGSQNREPETKLHYGTCQNIGFLMDPAPKYFM